MRDRGGADDVGDPRDLHPARPRPARLHADRLRRRRARCTRSRWPTRSASRACSCRATPATSRRSALLASDIKHDDVRTRVGPLRERAGRCSPSCSRRWRRRRARQLELEGFAPDAAAPAPLARPALPRPGLRAERGGRPSALDARRHRGRLPSRSTAATYGHADPSADHRARQRAADRLRRRRQAGGRAATGARARRWTTRSSSARPCGSTARAHDCPVWERERLPERAELRGPAIVEEFGATTVVPPGWRGRRRRARQPELRAGAAA